eukprot:6036729-Pyramimonas_sp.AAC.1
MHGGAEVNDGTPAPGQMLSQDATRRDVATRPKPCAPDAEPFASSCEASLITQQAIAAPRFAPSGGV